MILWSPGSRNLHRYRQTLTYSQYDLRYYLGNCRLCRHPCLMDDCDYSPGTPLQGEQFYILNQRRQPVPQGEEGEICIAGNGLARGYWNRPELTTEKFVPNPCCPTQRLDRLA